MRYFWLGLLMYRTLFTGMSGRHSPRPAEHLMSFERIERMSERVGGQQIIRSKSFFGQGYVISCHVVDLGSVFESERNNGRNRLLFPGSQICIRAVHLV